MNVKFENSCSHGLPHRPLPWRSGPGAQYSNPRHSFIFILCLFVETSCIYSRKVLLLIHGNTLWKLPVLVRGNFLFCFVGTSFLVSEKFLFVLSNFCCWVVEKFFFRLRKLYTDAKRSKKIVASVLVFSSIAFSSVTLRNRKSAHRVYEFAAEISMIHKDWCYLTSNHPWATNLIW